MARLAFWCLPCKGIPSACGVERDTHRKNSPTGWLKMLPHECFLGDSSQYPLFRSPTGIQIRSLWHAFFSGYAQNPSRPWFRSRLLWPPCLMLLVNVALVEDKSVLSPECLSVAVHSARWQRCNAGLAAQYVCMLSQTLKGSRFTNIYLVRWSGIALWHLSASSLSVSAILTVVCPQRCLNVSIPMFSLAATPSVEYELST